MSFYAFYYYYIIFDEIITFKIDMKSYASLFFPTCMLMICLHISDYLPVRLIIFFTQKTLLNLNYRKKRKMSSVFALHIKNKKERKKYLIEEVQ